MSHPFVSIITPSLDGRTHLETLLPSVLAQDYPADRVEVIVVDNGSVDGTDRLLAKQFSSVRVIRNAQNAGFARANNQAAEAARGDYLALLNNDVRIPPDWLSSIVRCAETSGPETVCVASRILSWDGATVDFVDGAMSFNGIGFQLHAGLPADSPEGRSTADEVLFASGAAMLIEREPFLDCGGFDEDYFAYYEDVDLGWRLWVLGYRVALCPEAVAYHRRNASQGARHRTTYLLERNALWSVIKNYDERSLQIALPAALMLAARRAASRAGSYADAAAQRKRLRLRASRRLDAAVVSLEGLASVAAVDAVVEALPRVLEKRRWIQARRARPDSEVLRLFKTPFRVGAEDNQPSRETELLRELGVVEYFESLLGDGAGTYAPGHATATS